MRLLNILKCLYRLPEHRETIKDINELLAAANKDINERLAAANLEHMEARLGALENYASAVTQDRIEPLESQVQTLREALERFAVSGAVSVSRAAPPEEQAASPLPEGLDSREEALEMFYSLSIDGAPRDELRGYAEADCDRFLHTLNLVRSDAKRLLEIGANPYFCSMLFKEFRSADLDFTNYFRTGPKRGAQTVRYENHQGKKRKWRVEYAKVNSEKNPFPEEDGAFDHVVFCEVLEHLTNDPLFALIEINRVLENGGTLVLSTPNVARLENAAALLSGANIYDPYSGYGPYGRHNREYTGRELTWLLQYVGFEVETFFTLDASPNNAARYFDVETLKPLVAFREQDLGHYMFVRAIKRRDVSHSLKRPLWLYRSFKDRKRLANLTLLDDPLRPGEEA